MSEPWTAEQREWLQAMGHTVWSLAPPEALAAERTPESHDEPATSSPRGAMREAAALLARDERPARQTPAQSGARSAQGGDRLMQALLRAAGGADETQVKDIAGEISALRGNATAKRALWPRLRALRKVSRG